MSVLLSKSKKPPEREASKYRKHARVGRAQPPKCVAGPAMGAVGMDMEIR